MLDHIFDRWKQRRFPLHGATHRHGHLHMLGGPRPIKNQLGYNSPNSLLSGRCPDGHRMCRPTSRRLCAGGQKNMINAIKIGVPASPAMYGHSTHFLIKVRVKYCLNCAHKAGPIRPNDLGQKSLVSQDHCKRSCLLARWPGVRTGQTRSAPDIPCHLHPQW